MYGKQYPRRRRVRDVWRAAERAATEHAGHAAAHGAGQPQLVSG
jgi:hypothetical protein